MPQDYVLCGLIDQNWLARQTYHTRQREERSPGIHGLSVRTQHERTRRAEAAWKAAEAAVWRHRAYRALLTTSVAPV